MGFIQEVRLDFIDWPSSNRDGFRSKDEMNIKGFGINNLIPLEQRQKTEGPQIRSESGSDRDADGRRQREEQDHKDEEPLTEEQVQMAIDYLKNHPGVKDNHLTVKRTVSQEKILLLIEDHLGKVVRRIPQSQIQFLAQSKDDPSSKGRLYDKAT